MKTRVITGVVAIAAFILLLFYLPSIYVTVVFAAFCGIGVWELLYATHSIGRHPLLYLSCLTAFAVPFTLRSAQAGLWPFVGLVFLYLLIACGCAVFDHEHIGFAHIGKGMFATIVVPFLFTSFLRILAVEDMGKYYVLMPWITVWVCDSMALFVGKAFGKHKLAPYVSPKKTIEGALGGIVGGVLAMAIYVLVMERGFQVHLDLLPALIFGLLGAIIGQLGDLSLSVIKREAGIKDYGKVFPGHGGVWDRFDSILFTAPLFEIIYLHILPRL